jgi:drug/metabolite transporter (DMT)-like permease
MVKLAIMMGMLAVVGFAGAYLSVQVRNNQCHWAWSLLCTFGSGMIWIWQARDNHMTLAQASVLFEIVYGFAYFIGFLYMGQVARWQDWVGMGLSTLGLFIISG